MLSLGVEDKVEWIFIPTHFSGGGTIYSNVFFWSDYFGRSIQSL